MALTMSNTNEQIHKKRKRTSLVCDSCKKKKIKCDRNLPCLQCTKSKISDKCTYENNGGPINEEGLKYLPYVNSAKNPIAFASSREENRPDTKAKKVISPRTEEVVMQKEDLELLKGRLEHIEGLLNQRNQQVPEPPKEPMPGYYKSHANPVGKAMKLPSPFDASFQNGLENMTQGKNSPIQLPPLNLDTPDSDSVKFERTPGELSLGTTPGSTNSSNSLPSSRSSTSCINMLYGINPYGDQDEKINFYENYTSIHVQEPMRRINFGPFAWSSLMKIDTGLSILWDYMIVQKKKSRENNPSMVFAQATHEITQENTNAISSTYESDKLGNTEKAFKKRALQTDGYDDMVPYNNILKARIDRDQKSKLNAEALSLGLTFYDGQIDREIQLIDKIQVILPTKKVIWKLIKRYFTWLYPFMPFLDQESFVSEITKILGPESFEDTKIKEIKVEKRLDLAHIGVLLIVLRLSYLSMFCNKSLVNEERLRTTDPNPEAQEMKFLLSNPININTIDVAQICLDQFQLLRKSSLPILQLAFFMRTYHAFAPEDGDGADGGDSQAFNALLIQMAYSLGLNREPDKFGDVCNDPKLNHLGRKIWCSLVFYDMHLAFTFGNQMSVSPMCYDTKPPFVQPGNENIADFHMDRYVTQAYFSCCASFTYLREILLLVLDVNGHTKMSQLCKLLTDFETTSFEEYGTLEGCLKPLEKNCHSYVFKRNFKTKIYLSLKSFFISIYFHLYHYYETKNKNLSFFYLKKMLLTSISDIMPHYFDLLGNSDIICDFIINPTLESIIHKANQLNLACLVKTNFILFHFIQSKDHHDRLIFDSNYRQLCKTLSRLSLCLTSAAEFSISAISKISNRYYYAWRITKGHTYLLKTITTREFYIENYHKARHVCTCIFSIEQMEELINICEPTLNRVGKYEAESMEFYNEFCKGFTSDDNTRHNSGTSSSYEDTTKNGAWNSAKNESKEAGNNIDKDFASNFVDNADIDKLWFQMLSMKRDSNIYDPNIYPDNPDVMGYNDVSSLGTQSTTVAPDELPESQAANSQTSNQNNFGSNFERFGFDLEQNLHFDIFSDLPFDQVFNVAE